MARERSEHSQKRRTILFWLLLALVVLSLAVGGVSAYLSISAASAQNTFSNAGAPGVAVDGTTVTVTPNGYAVYLRAAVDLSWKNGNAILAEEPSGDYITAGNSWVKIGDFYYYTSPITSTTSVTIGVSGAAKGDYTLAATVAAQVIQAVGTVDGGSTTAVQAAWGVAPSAFISN